MPKQDSKAISAIIRSEDELERTISQLLAESVSRSDISVQGGPDALKEKYGIAYLPPEDIKNKNNPPTHEAYMQDDYGWKVGFSFAIPFFICLVLSIVIVSDIQSTADILLYGGIGALIGSILGYLIAKRVSAGYQKKVHLQEEEGGFVIWVKTHNEEQHAQVLKILKKHHSKL